MALDNFALITLAEAKQELNLPAEATTNDANIEELINLCTAQIESHLRRQIRSRATEFTDLVSVRRENGLCSIVYTLDRPAFTITSVKEANVQAAGDFWATVTALTEGVDYCVIKPRGRFERLQSGWSSDLRAAEAEWYPSGLVSGLGSTGGLSWATWVQIKYYAGFKGIDGLPTAAEALPDVFRAVCRQLVALSWREIARGMQGVQGVADETGNFTRFGPAKLTDAMKEMLRDEMRGEVTSNTTRQVYY